MKKHRNLPFFVPFAGCKHRCIFCSQEKITGRMSLEDTEKELVLFDRMMENAGDLSDTENQIAFFGGSFTNLPRERMLGLLKRANVWLDRGVASSIRISTRPDCIDEEIVAILKEYRVTDVELGIQSMDDGVLLASGRGHSARHSRKAAALLAKAGLRLTGQMMIGLPCSDEEKELATAKAICNLGAAEARIYPTVVFAGTPLYEKTLAGEYRPLDNLTAAKRVMPCLQVFLEHSVRVLKIGLQSSEELHSAPFGPSDGSFAELAFGYYYAKQIGLAAGDRARGKALHILLPEGELSKLTGHGGAVLQEIQNTLSPASVVVRTDVTVPLYHVKLEIKGT